MRAGTDIILIGNTYPRGAHEAATDATPSEK